VNFNIRSAIMQKLKKMPKEDLKDLIEDSIKEGEEKLLPGLGCIFELIWQKSSKSERENMVTLLKQALDD